VTDSLTRRLEGTEARLQADEAVDEPARDLVLAALVDDLAANLDAAPGRTAPAGARAQSAGARGARPGHAPWAASSDGRFGAQTQRPRKRTAGTDARRSAPCVSF
jgi:hypothetical protein